MTGAPAWQRPCVGPEAQALDTAHLLKDEAPAAWLRLLGSSLSAESFPSAQQQAVLAPIVQNKTNLSTHYPLQLPPILSFPSEQSPLKEPAVFFCPLSLLFSSEHTLSSHSHSCTDAAP